jgi:hypothetical protein
MTPQEKAEAIHTKMYFIISNNGQFTGEHSIPHKWEEAKKCAIIAADETKEQLISNLSNDISSIHAIYWEKVKQEIEKL